jgi:hypothetical protein
MELEIFFLPAFESLPGLASGSQLCISQILGCKGTD